MADETVSSGADLASSFSPSAGSDSGGGSPTPGADASPAGGGDSFDVEEPASPDAPDGEESLNYDELNDQGNPDDAVAAAAVEEELPVVDELPPPAVDELPEGVRKGKDRNGKDGFWLRPERYETFHNAHKLLRDGEALIGEPLTVEALDHRQKALLGQEKLYADMLSGDPKLQANLINHFFEEAQRAKDEGEVGVDPMVSFTGAMYDRLQTSPEAYAALRSRAASDLVKEMFQEAAATNNRSLWLSTQHFQKNLGMEITPETEMANLATTGQTNPMSAVQAENERLRQELNGRSSQDQAAQFETWRGGVNQNIQKSLTDQVITPALKSVADSYTKFPETYKQVQDMLHSKILAGFNGDPSFRDRVNTLLAQAKRAPSQQKRQEFSQQIVSLHANKARLIVDAVKAPILREAAVRLKAQSDATHQRRTVAQQQRAPAGGGVPPQRSLAPTRGMDFEMGTPDNLAKSLAGLFPR